MQLGTNHMGHWALIAGDKGLLPNLKAQACTLKQPHVAQVLREYALILFHSISFSCDLYSWHHLKLCTTQLDIKTGHPVAAKTGEVGEQMRCCEKPMMYSRLVSKTHVAYVVTSLHVHSSSAVFAA